MKTQRDSAIDFLQSIFRPGIDRVSILQFSEVVEQLQRFATRLESLNQAIRSVKPGGGTSLYDAVYLAAKTLSRQRGRRVIVVVSDGEDTTSQISLDESLRAAQDSEAVLYALVVQPIKGEVGRNLAGEHTMIFLANRTGGRFFRVASAESLRSSYLSISDELRTQYYLGYYPKRKTTNRGFHKIEVRASDLTHKVRAREGYYSVK